MSQLSLSFKEAQDIIEADGKRVVPLLQGEPGIGKSSIGKAIADKLGYHFAYIDMANISLGDLMMPVVNREMKCTEFYPNEVFQLHTGEPVVIMYDEWTKAGKDVKNMTLPGILEHRLGSIKFHPDTIQFATGNLSGDGVGDSIQAHQLNRFDAVHMRKPTAEEWINNFAVNNDVDPTVIAFVDQFPQVMESYLNDPDGTNPYIFNPKKQQKAYVSPRSLKFASDVIKTRDLKTPNALQAQLVGLLGESGAADLANFVRINEELPPFAAIVSNPTGCALPNQPVNRLLLTFNLIMRCDKDSIVACVKYMERMNNEMQALFFNKLLSNQSKSAWVAQVKEVGDRVQKLHHLY